MSGSRRREDLLLAGWCLLVVGLGIWLRAQRLGEPQGLAWDEHHFVKTAQNYLTGAKDWNDHPPLGKLLITGHIQWFGDSAWSWRLSAFESGTLNVALAGILAARLFESWRAGFIAAAFVALDGFFIAYSRTALLDGVVATFTLASACALARAKSAWQVGLGAVLIGLGCAVKFSVVVMLVPLFGVALFGRAPRWSVLLAALGPLAYFLVYRHGLWLQHQPHGPADVWNATVALYEHHARLTDMKHVFVSPWYTWFLPLKPIPMRYSETEGIVRSMSSMGNPLSWWGASLAVFVTFATVVSVAWEVAKAKYRARPTPLSALGAVDGAELWALFFFALPVLPWVISRRDSYIYHYLPAYGFAVVLLAGKLGALVEARRRAGWLAVGLITLAGLWVCPVSAELPVTRVGYELRLWLPAWRRAPQKRVAPPAPPLSAVAPAPR